MFVGVPLFKSEDQSKRSIKSYEQNKTKQKILNCCRHLWPLNAKKFEDLFRLIFFLFLVIILLFFCFVCLNLYFSRFSIIYKWKYIFTFDQQILIHIDLWWSRWKKLVKFFHFGWPKWSKTKGSIVWIIGGDFLSFYCSLFNDDDNNNN